MRTVACEADDRFEPPATPLVAAVQVALFGGCVWGAAGGFAVVISAFVRESLISYYGFDWRGATFGIPFAALAGAAGAILGPLVGLACCPLLWCAFARRDARSAMHGMLRPGLAIAVGAASIYEMRAQPFCYGGPPFSIVMRDLSTALAVGMIVGAFLTSLWLPKLTDASNPPPVEPPTCPNCGYDVRASMSFARCPECGRPLLNALVQKRLAALPDPRKLGLPWAARSNDDATNRTDC